MTTAAPAKPADATATEAPDVNALTHLAASDVADLAGVTFATVNNWAKGEDFPAPIAIVSRGRTKVWEASSVKKWLEARKAADAEKAKAEIAKLEARLAALKGEG